MKLAPNANLISNSRDTNISSINGSRQIIPARVVDVILDENHPEYSKYGGELSIGAIKFSPIDRVIDTKQGTYFPVAFNLNPSFRQFPLINEIVLILSAPSSAISVGRSTEYVDYYISTVNIWNNTINQLPDISLDQEEVDLGYEFDQNTSIKPLHPFHGDTIIEGRHGQSLRFTGARSPKNPFTNKENAGRPLTTLINGLIPVNQETPELFTIENINKDDSSIYLTSDHIIPLEQVRDKYAGSTERPILAKNFQGKQIILNSGRLIFNAKEDDMLFTSNEFFSVSSNKLSLDGVEFIGLDATKIYLGEKAVRFELEPVVLGNQLEIFLDTLLSELERLGNALTKAKTVDQKPIPTLNMEGPILKAYVKTLRNRINPNGVSQLKSKKVFTE